MEISIDEYKELITTKERVETFERYVNSEKYPVEREKCGIILNFEVKENGKDRKQDGC